MRSSSALSLAVVLLAAAASHLANGQVSCSQCASAGYQPVCANGQTYANSCYAQCNGYNSFTYGFCGTTSGATRSGSYPNYWSRSRYNYNIYNNRNPYNYRNYYRNYRSNYRNYNQYRYNYNNYNNRNAGGNCNCPSNYDPVCAYASGSSARNTYLNSCIASCLGARVINRGFC
ncbi:hypothetical protein BOX15_Mlig029904g3 [Macrostomum lignano]|uniref:Kazal-like domain-containing protein n=1 Tax=Macrostomum lignano TaxID=282301 RepID=A0A267FN25_9PLAT|nr:hypothetical protein BOX15_Mlig029904g1 [Macrostomum lignano]PAA75186.1 hypothetical protein BOX15_Mlig029904g3 [Macrostomum lignano]